MIDISEPINKNKTVFKKWNLLNKSLIFSSSILFTPLLTFVDAVKVIRTGQSLSDANRGLVTHTTNTNVAQHATNTNVAQHATNTNVAQHATNTNVNRGLVTHVIGPNVNSMPLLRTNVQQALSIDFSLHNRSSSADASVLTAHSSGNPVSRQSNREGGKRQRTDDVESITGGQSDKKSRNSAESKSTQEEDMTLYLEMLLGKDDADRIQKYRANFIENQNIHEIQDNIFEMEEKTPPPYPNRKIIFEFPEYLQTAYKEGVDKYAKIKENLSNLKIFLDLDIFNYPFQSLISKQMFLKLHKEVLDYSTYIQKCSDLLNDRIKIFEKKYSKIKGRRKNFFYDEKKIKTKTGIKNLFDQIDSLKKEYITKYDITKVSDDILSSLKTKSKEIEMNLEIYEEAKQAYEKWEITYNESKDKLNYMIEFLSNSKEGLQRSLPGRNIQITLYQELIDKSFALDRQFYNITQEWDNFCLKYEYLKKGMQLKSSSVSQHATGSDAAQHETGFNSSKYLENTRPREEDMTLYLEMLLGKDDADKIKKYRADFIKNKNIYEIKDNILVTEAKTPQPYPNRILKFESPIYLLTAYKEGLDKFKKIKENLLNIKNDLDVDIDKDNFKSLISEQIFLNLRKEVLDYHTYIEKWLAFLNDRIKIFEKKYSEIRLTRSHFFHHEKKIKEKPDIKNLFDQIDSLKKEYIIKYDTTNNSSDILSTLKIKSQAIEMNLEVYEEAKQAYEKWERIYNEAKDKLNYIIEFLSNSKEELQNSVSGSYIYMVLDQELAAKSFALDRKFYNIIQEWENFCLKYEYLKKGMPLKSSSVSQPATGSNAEQPATGSNSSQSLENKRPREEDMTLYLEMLLGKEDADKIKKYREDFSENQTIHEIKDHILGMEEKTPKPYPNLGLTFESPEYLLKAYKEGVDKYKKIKENFFKLKIDLDVDIDKDKFQSLISKQMFLNLRKEVLDYRSYIPKWLDLLDDRIKIFEQKYSAQEYPRKYFFNNVNKSKEKPDIKNLLIQIDSFKKEYITKYDTTKESDDILSSLNKKSKEIEMNLEVYEEAKQAYEKWERIYNEAKDKLNYMIKFLKKKKLLRSSAEKYIYMVLYQELVEKLFVLDRQFYNITKEWENFCLKYEYLKKGMSLKSSSVSHPTLNTASTNLPELQRYISEASTSQETSFLYSGNGGNSKSRPFFIEGVEVMLDKVKFFSLENFKRWKDTLDEQINFLSSYADSPSPMVHRYIDDFKAASAKLDEFNIQLLNNGDFSEKNKLILPLAQKFSESLELAMGYILRNEFINRNLDNINSFDARIKNINLYLEINNVFKELNKSLYDFFYDIINKKIDYFRNESKHAGNREQVRALNEYLLIFKTDFMTKLKFHTDLEIKISDNRNILIEDLSKLISIFEEKISKSENLSVTLKQTLIDAQDIKSKYDGGQYTIPISGSNLNDIDNYFKNIEDKLAILYKIPDLELIIPDSERTMTNLERTIHNPEDMIHNPEDVIHNPEDMIHNPEDVIHNPEDMIHNPEDMIHNPEDMIHNPEDVIHNPEDMIHNPEDMIHNPEYAMSDLERTMPDLELITPGLERTIPGLERI